MLKLISNEVIKYLPTDNGFNQPWRFAKVQNDGKLIFKTKYQHETEETHRNEFTLIKLTIDPYLNEWKVYTPIIKDKYKQNLVHIWRILNISMENFLESLEV